jgi:hypothetical protein
MEIGTANYSSGNKTKIEKIKDGDNIYRILPPLGSLAQKGLWNRYIAVEWGYKDLKGNNRPFQDVRKVNFKTKMVEVESAAHLVREHIAANFKQVLELYKSGKASQEQVNEAKKKQEQYNLDKKYYLNAINLKGEIVLLKIGYKAMEGLKSEISKLKAKGVDPLALNTGRFFNINRTGTGLGTIYQTTVATETIDVPGIGKVQKELEHVIDASIISRLANEATDLSTLDKLYQVVSAEQVQKMVEGGPAAVTAILGDRDSKGSLADDGADEPELQMNNAPVTPAVQPVTGNIAVNVPIAETKPLVSPVAITQATQTLTPAASAEPMDKDAFLKSLGL